MTDGLLPCCWILHLYLRIGSSDIANWLDRHVLYPSGDPFNHLQYRLLSSSLLLHWRLTRDKFMENMLCRLVSLKSTKETSFVQQRQVAEGERHLARVTATFRRRVSARKPTEEP